MHVNFYNLIKIEMTLKKNLIVTLIECHWPLYNFMSQLYITLPFHLIIKVHCNLRNWINHHFIHFISFHFILPTQLYNDPATCHNNKLTDLICDGVREVDWKQAKIRMKVPQPPIRRGGLEGDRKEDNRTEKKEKKTSVSQPQLSKDPTGYGIGMVNILL